MSLDARTGYTIATVFVTGVLILFVVPALSYALLQGFSYMLLPLHATCNTIVGGCTTEEKVVETSYGAVTVYVTRLPETSVVARIANVSTDILLALLLLISRVEVMAAALAVDLITMAYEISE